MLSLPELSQTYKNSHPQYINPLAYFDVTDHELADLKREALFPYLENLEEKMVKELNNLKSLTRYRLD